MTQRNQILAPLLHVMRIRAAVTSHPDSPAVVKMQGNPVDVVLKSSLAVQK